jgi:hypothetical protein
MRGPGGPAGLSLVDEGQIGQTASKFPFRWWGMNSTVSGRHQLNGQLRPHSAEEGPLDAFFILTRQNGRFVT